MWELPTLKHTLQRQRKYHCLTTASKQPLLGKAYNNTDSDVFYMRSDANLAVVKLTTVQMIKFSLKHKICKLGMICSVKPVPTQVLCVVQKEEFLITCYMCEIYT
jgi:hypothetical protein